MTVPQSSPTAGLNRSFLTLLSANLVAVLGQVLSGFASFLDIYFVTRIGQETLSTYALVNGWNIIGIAFLGGVMQSFLILGGRSVGEGLHADFVRTFQSAIVMTLLTALAVHTAVALAVLAQDHLSPELPANAPILALTLIPGSICAALTVILRMRAIILSRMGLFIAIPVLGVLIKLAVIWSYQQGIFAYLFRSTLSSGVATVSVAFTLTSGMTLLLALMLTLATGGWEHLRPVGPRAAIATRALVLVGVGIQIGIVVGVELAVLGVGQLMVGFHFPDRSGSFGVAVQAVVLIETVAVAMSQVTTVVAAIAVSKGRVQLLSVTRSSFAICIALHGAILVALILSASRLARALMPQDSLDDPAMLAVLTHDLKMVAVVQLLMGIVILLASVLRGVGDISRPVVLVMVNYLGLGLGSSVLLLFFFSDLRQDAVWAGIILSLLGSVVALAFRVRSHLQDGGRDVPSQH